MNDSKNKENCQSTIPFAVYVIWCMPTEKFYVGVTRQKNVYTRIRQHKKGKQFVDVELKQAGWENCDWWIVEKNISAENIDEREKYWVDLFDCVYPKGYNKTHGGIGHITVSDDTRAKISKAALERDISGENNPMYGKTHTEEVKAAQSAKMKGKNNPNYGKPPANKGKKASPEIKAKLSAANKGEKNGFYGKRHTEETKEKISKANSGKHPSDEARAKMSESHKRENLSDETIAKMSDSHTGEKNHFYGKHHTEESKEKNRQAHIGQVPWNKGKKGLSLTAETRAKMSESHKGKKLSDETRAKLSAAKSGENHHMYGKHHTPETRVKMSAAHKAKAADKKAAKLAAENLNKNDAQDKTS